VNAEGSSICALAGHDWEDMGGGMEVCSECLEERETPRAAKVSCLMCGEEGHPSNMCVIAESVDDDCAEYYCQGCRWGL
jgi:hypothetical protein